SRRLRHAASRGAAPSLHGALPISTGARPRLDGVGAVLSAVGLGLGVLGVLQSSTWGWVQPRNPPFTVLGFAPTLFVVGAGAVVRSAEHASGLQSREELVRRRRLVQ